MKLPIKSNKSVYYIYILLALVASLFVLVFSGTTSPLLCEDGLDSAVFKIIGIGILKGEVPYLDLFDHKGPLLYFINALGYVISDDGRMGLYIIQCVSLFVTVVLWFHTSRLFTSTWKSFFCTLMALAVMSCQYEGGNLGEEYMLPYASMSLYLALSYMIRNGQEHHPWYYSVLYGICFGAMFMIRPNDACSQVGAIIFGLACYFLYKRYFRQLFVNGLYLLVGICISVAPIVIFFAVHGAINELWYGLIVHNSLYAGGLKSMIAACFATKYFIAIIGVVAALLIWKSAHKKILWIMIPLYAFTLLFTGARAVPHYYMMILPGLIVFMAVGIMEQKGIEYKVAMLSVLLMYYYRPIYQAGKAAIKEVLSFDSSFKEQQDAASDILLSYIPVDERDDIYAYNIFNLHLYEHNHLLPCNKTFVFMMKDIDPRLYEEENLTNTSPKWVLVERGDAIHTFDDIEVLETKYVEVARTDSTITDMSLYKRLD